jgi:hypothetical protein
MYSYSLSMVDRDEGRRKVPMRFENPAESRLRLISLQRQGIYSFTGAGVDYDVFEPHDPGTNTISTAPLLYSTPSVDLALFFALIVNNPLVKNDRTMKTITCDHSINGYDRDIYIGAEKRAIDAANVPDNSGWVAVFRPRDLRSIRLYSNRGRASELATDKSTIPWQLIKVTNADFPYPIEAIPLYTPNPDLTSEQRRNHEPFKTVGFPCFDKTRPFARVFPIPTMRPFEQEWS